MGTEIMNENLLGNLLILQERINNILPKAPAILAQFYENIEDGFADQMPDPLKRNSVTCAAQCIRIILSCKCFSGLASTIENDSIEKFFNEYDWKSAGIEEHNLFTAPLALYVMKELGIKRKDNAKIRNAIDFIVSTLKKFLKGDEPRPRGAHTRVDCGHAFIVFWTVSALMMYEKELRKNEKQVLRGLIEYAKSSLFRQLALYLAEDEAEFDVVQLAYFLAASSIYAEDLNRIVIEKAAHVIFERQQADGTWKLSKPFLHGPEGVVMTCFSVEAPTAVLLIPDIEHLLPKYVDALANTLRWIERNLIRVGEKYLGWRSDSHLPAKSPESWSSALVYEFLDTLSNAVQNCVQNLILEELRGRIIPPKFGWEKVIDYNGFKKSLEDKIINSISRDRGAHPHENSAVLLYGPPGTGKDTIVYAMAEELGNWTTVTLHSTNFTIHGPDQIIHSAKRIFDMLILLEDVVVFFNEVDELVVARDIEADVLGRSITNSMLPWFEELKSKGKVVFVVSTNHVERFDKAIRRRGRFDLVLPIGPPELEEKIRLIKDLCPSMCNNRVQRIASEMDRKITISEIVEFCRHMKNTGTIGRKGMMKKAREMIKEINDHTEIDVDTMANFAKTLKLARY